MQVGPRLKRKAGGLDLLLARHEDKDVACRVPQVHCNRLFHCSLDVVLLQAADCGVRRAGLTDTCRMQTRGSCNFILHGMASSHLHGQARNAGEHGMGCKLFCLCALLDSMDLQIDGIQCSL